MGPSMELDLARARLSVRLQAFDGGPYAHEQRWFSIVEARRFMGYVARRHSELLRRWIDARLNRFDRLDDWRRQHLRPELDLDACTFLDDWTGTYLAHQITAEERHRVLEGWLAEDRRARDRLAHAREGGH